MKTSLNLRFWLAALAGIATITTASAVVIIDFVAVDNIGNAADSADGDQNTPGIQNFGSVAYKYQISTKETTLAQYAEFLNAVAATDTHGLYNLAMGTDANSSGIQRTGPDGSYTYTVIGSGDRPVTYVSWFDAARFANWLHHGQPVGSQTTGTTEDGAYSLLGAVSGTGFVKDANAQVWLPSEDEWYKAAYYDPTKNTGAGGYWLQANQSNVMPGNDPATAGAANFFVGDFATTPGNGVYSASQNYLTAVGAYGVDSQSFYGTNDQAGNVWEWNDAVEGLTDRGLRGGNWGDNDPSVLSSAFRLNFLATAENANIGFRVAAVPEPGALVLTVLCGAGLLARRRR